MRLAILLLCCALTFGQNTGSTPQTEQKSQADDFGLGVGAPGKEFGSVDVLTDTEGVDFGPYLKEVLKDIRENWYHLIPESAERKKGKLAIEFAIKQNGQVASMKLVASSGDIALDRPAWGSITASSPFTPLPAEFTKPFLALRIRFYYNPDGSGSHVIGKNLTDLFKSALSEIPTKPNPAVRVSISGLTDLRVPLGDIRVITALVTGTGSQDNAVVWSVSGFGCSGAACGEMTKGTYHAPTVMPNPPFVTLTAISKTDPSAKASITVHIVDNRSQ